MAGLVIGAVGVDALRHSDDKRTYALAAVPVVLATHQLIEAVAWWGLQDRVPPGIGEMAVTIYLIIAFGLVPALVPYAAMASEPLRRRRLLMAPFVAMGAVVAVALLYGLAADPYGASIGGRFIAYEVVTPGGGMTVALYGLAVCCPLLLSSARRLVIFGCVNIPVLVGLSVLISAGLISLWCIWAAFSSLLIAREIRARSPVRSDRRHRLAESG
jgi:hypothetical protein